MQKDCSAVWKDCLSLIRSQIPEQSFNTWFSPIIPVRLSEEILTIQVPSQFFYEWLEEHYVNVLKKAITSVLGPAGKLEYSVIVDKGNAQSNPLTVKFPNGSGNRRGFDSKASNHYKSPIRS
jgi:chromosomal replication initiator protein